MAGPFVSTRPKSRKKYRKEVTFDAAPGSRLLTAGLTGLLSVMFLIHQTQIEGINMLIRLLSAAATIGFGGLAWYFMRRGLRRGPVLRVGPDGFGIALGFNGWVDIPWEHVRAFRYWEPTGLAFIVKKNQARWVGVLLDDQSRLRNLSWDVRMEIWLNTFFDRPGLTVLHPFVKAPILDVLQAFKDHAPKALDDYEWMSK